MILEDCNKGWEVLELSDVTLTVLEEPVFRFVVAGTDDTHDASIHVITPYTTGRFLDPRYSTLYNRTGYWWGITSAGFLSWEEVENDT